jgi:hypothetical protein
MIAMGRHGASRSSIAAAAPTPIASWPADANVPAGRPLRLIALLSKILVRVIAR